MVTLTADNLSDDVSITIVDDEVFTAPEELEVTLNAADENQNNDAYAAAEPVKFIIEDDDDPLGTITISKVTPPSFDKDVAAQTVTLEVTVELEDASEDPTTVVVTLGFEALEANGDAVTGDCVARYKR